MAGGSDYYVLEGDPSAILRPSEKVPLSDLSALADEHMCLLGRFLDPTPYSPTGPTDQYPILDDGSPMMRDGGFRVERVGCDDHAVRSS